MDIKHLSFSSLSLWAQCQGAWWEKYIENRETVSDAARFGSAFDQAISKRMGLISEIKDTYDGIDSAVNFYFAQPWAWGKADAAQKEINITPQQWETASEMLEAESEIFLPIVGYVDLIRNEGIVKKIVDIKTSSRAGWRSSWGLQLMLYALAENAQVAEIHLLVTGKKCPTAHRYVIPVTPAKLKWCMETLGCWAKQIADYKKGTPLNLSGGYWCSWCPKRLNCVASQMENVSEVSG
jgi:hypothetical protein